MAHPVHPGTTGLKFKINTYVYRTYIASLFIFGGKKPIDFGYDSYEKVNAIIWSSDNVHGSVLILRDFFKEIKALGLVYPYWPLCNVLWACFMVHVVVWSFWQDTPARTRYISGLKSQLLKLFFWLKQFYIVVYNFSFWNSMSMFRVATAQY